MGDFHNFKVEGKRAEFAARYTFSRDPIIIALMALNKLLFDISIAADRFPTKV